MAREDIQKLYRELVDGKFLFMQSGLYDLDTIYQSVKNQYPDLCDDSYLCIDNCSNGHNTPEWEHAVRKALDRLKKTSNDIRSGVVHRTWRIRDNS